MSSRKAKAVCKINRYVNHISTAIFKITYSDITNMLKQMIGRSENLNSLNNI